MMKTSNQRLLYLMVFLSGFAGLVYQVLWMRQLGLLFGNTSHAAAATLAVFFAGLAGGSWFWGRRSASTANALRSYARLEVGIALSALVYFIIFALFRSIYPSVYQNIQSPAILLVVKGFLSLLLVFPPAFFMGGTIPLIGQYMIRQQDRFGRITALLYGINTIGAALGAFLSGFVFVAHLGFNLTCVLAMAITSGIALTAFALSKGAVDATWQGADDELEGTSKKAKKKQNAERAKREREATPRWVIYALSFMSGFSVLALEVLWTRIFAQLHENSVYSFASVLVVVLLCLALGALLASLLTRLAQPPLLTLMWLTILGGSAIAIFPFVLMALTNDFQVMKENVSFAAFTLRVFLVSAASMGLPCILLGTIFPFLMKSEERYAQTPGKSIGTLTAVNTVGAIAGSLICGFVMLHVFGMWRTVQLIALGYLVIGLAASVGAQGNPFSRFSGMGYGAFFLLLLWFPLNPTTLAVTGNDTRLVGEVILETWETSDCTVSAIQYDQGKVSIKVNSHYSLGSTGTVPFQVLQARIPLLMFPETKSVFFLGLGTGITAGSSLDKDLFPLLEGITICEIVPEVIEASEKYIGGGNGGQDFTGGLFTDPRVTLLAEDGRHFLMATDQTFDMINADLFLTFRSGVSNLYTVEHFQQAKERLNPGGVFVQWLPNYQMTKFEFMVIARTMLDVFDQVTLWRNELVPGREVMALMGHTGAGQLPASDLDVHQLKVRSIAGADHTMIPHLQLPFDEQTTLLLYAGNVSRAEKLFEDYPLNTDDRPVIEYSAPISLRESKGPNPPLFVGKDLLELVDEMLEITPPDNDPVLQQRSPENKRLVKAGAALQHAWIGMYYRDQAYWKESWRRFVREWTNAATE